MSVIEAPRADATGAEDAVVRADTLMSVGAPARPDTLSPEHLLVLQGQLCELAALEEDRVERVATMGLELVAAYDVGVRDAVRDALARIAAGTYGTCESCHELIPAARLDAVPYARRCATCQRRWEAGWDQVERLVGGVVRTLVGEPQGSIVPTTR
jgi:hypothetical protein